jgi:hypothetical protein
MKSAKSQEEDNQSSSAGSSEGAGGSMESGEENGYNPTDQKKSAIVCDSFRASISSDCPPENLVRKLY